MYKSVISPCGCGKLVIALKLTEAQGEATRESPQNGANDVTSGYPGGPPEIGDSMGNPSRVGRHGISNQRAENTGRKTYQLIALWGVVVQNITWTLLRLVSVVHKVTPVVGGNGQVAGEQVSGMGPNQNDHTPKRSHPERPQNLWLYISADAVRGKMAMLM